MQVLVLGMHRSGTSVVARLINLMGFNVGDPAAIGHPAFDNKKGFWEHRTVRDLNDRLLAAANCSWDDVVSFDTKNISAEERAAIEPDINNLLFEFDAKRPWLIKDPRFALTMQFWVRSLDVPLYVIPYRHPVAVAKSLLKRNGISIDVGVALWEQYVSGALRQTRNRPRLLVSYDRLIDSPAVVAAEIFKWLCEQDVSAIRMPTAVEIRALIEPGLRHFQIANDSEACSASAQRLYDWLNHPDLEFPSDWAPSDEGVQLLNELHQARCAAAGTTAATPAESPAVQSQPVANANQTGGNGPSTREPSTDIVERLTEAETNVKAALIESARALERSERAGREIIAMRDMLETALRDSNRNVSALRENIDAAMTKSTRALDRTEQAGQEFTALREFVEWIAREGLDNLENLPSHVKDFIGYRSGTRDRASPEPVEAGPRPDVLLLHGLLQQCHDEIQRLQSVQSSVRSFLAESPGSLAAIRQSMRWKLGNAICRFLEILTFRGRPRLAMDRLTELASQASQSRAFLTSDAEPLLRHIRRVVDIDTAQNRPSRAISALELKARTAPPDGHFDFIFFPVIDWHFRIQRPQHLARELGRLGHRVFYVSAQITANSHHNGFELLEEAADNVYLVRLHTRLPKVPNIYQDVLDTTAEHVVSDALGMVMQELEIASPIAVVDLPFWTGVARLIPGAVLVYDCMDHHEGFSTSKKNMLKLEKQLIRDSDIVVVTSDWLKHKIGADRDVLTIRNGAEVERFSVASESRRRPRRRRRPVVGYIGAIAEWFDLDLVTELALSMPDIDFKLVGAVTSIDVAKARKLRNMEFVGEVPYDQAPAYVAGFDVCMIPFRLCDLTMATNPVKAYEYLAAGKPVVATRLPELERMDGGVLIADNAKDFANSIHQALNDDDPAKADARREWAHRHDWLHRAQSLLDAVEKRFPLTSIVLLTWNNLDFTKACLASVEANTRYPNYELIIVDNASTDDTQAYLEEYASTRDNVRTIFNDENAGFAAGNNVGLREARGDFVVLLNNDTFVTPGWLQGLIGHLLRNPDLGMVGPVTNNIGNEARIDIHYANMEEMVEVAAEYTRARTRTLVPISVLGFFCCAFRTELLKSVGYLDEQFRRGFFEDDDYCRRIKQKGMNIAFAEDVFVHHHLSASFDTMDQQERAALFDENKRRFEQKWGAWTPHRYRDQADEASA